MNVTDFISFSELLKLFEVDLFDFCIEKLRSETTIGDLHSQDETLSRLSESVHAHYLSRDIAKIYTRTVFIRSSTDIRKPSFDLLMILHLFGVKNIYLEYRESILHELIQQDLQSNLERMISSGGLDNNTLP